MRITKKCGIESELDHNCLIYYDISVDFDSILLLSISVTLQITFWINRRRSKDRQSNVQLTVQQFRVQQFSSVQIDVSTKGSEPNV